jgi:hypothetical protein
MTVTPAGLPGVGLTAVALPGPYLQATRLLKTVKRRFSGDGDMHCLPGKPQTVISLPKTWHVCVW